MGNHYKFQDLSLEITVIGSIMDMLILLFMEAIFFTYCDVS